MPASDPFASYGISRDAPAVRSTPITPSDSDELTEITRSIYVGTAGDIVYRLRDDEEDRTLKNAPVGYHPLCVRLVKGTGTTADGIIALY